MDHSSLRCLLNSMSRFIHLVACHTVKTLLIQKDYVNMIGLLKLLKPVLDELAASMICLEEVLVNELEDLDVVVNEAREFLENWCPKMSKIQSVLQSEPLAMKVQSSTLGITRILYQLFHSSPVTSQLESIQKYIQDSQCFEQERISEFIKEALGDQQEHIVPRAEILIKIMQSLNLTSNQELLTESIALEKQRAKAQVLKNKEESDVLAQMVDLVWHFRNCTYKLELLKDAKRVPVPPYFRCPLSLELMLDPVIVASGQTYEKAFIQRWLDHGLTICPKTRQTLAHTNLVSNYTVKSLIENWCEDNSVKYPDTSTYNSNPVSPLSHDSHQVSPLHKRANSFCCSLGSSNSSSGLSHEVGRVELSITENSSSGCTEVSGSSCGNIGITELPVDLTPEFSAWSPLSKSVRCSPSQLVKQMSSSETREGKSGSEDSNHHRSLSLPCSDLSPDDVATSSHVKKLVEDLKSQCNEAQTAAAAELRLLAKHNMENRAVIGQCGAIAPLVSLLYSMVKLTQEHAVTALLNLSINEDNKVMIADAGALEPLILVLKSGSVGAKENSAATLFSLSVLEQYKIKIGRSGAVKALVDLLGSGTLRGKKDAATALFNLSIFHENKARIVQAGAVKYLIRLMDPDSGMADKAIALLANLSTIPEGRSAITHEEGIPLLVEVIEMGSQRGKENAAFILWQLCISNHKFCSLILREGAVPPLVALVQSGTRRAKEKAQQILSHFRDQREGPVAKAKS